MSGFIDTTGFTQLVITNLNTNSTGTTSVTLEGSFDGTTLDSDISYGAAIASSATAVVVVPVLTPYIRVRIVQATATATVTKVYIQARA